MQSERRGGGGKEFRGMLDLRGAAITKRSHSRELQRYFGSPRPPVRLQLQEDGEQGGADAEKVCKRVKHTIILLDYIGVLTVTGLRRVQMNSSVVVHGRSARLASTILIWIGRGVFFFLVHSLYRMKQNRWMGGSPKKKTKPLFWTV